MSALDSSSLPPTKLNNNQKYPVISSASPVICLMLATSGTVCLCQDQKSHGSHVMSAYIKPPALSLPPPLSALLQRGRIHLLHLHPPVAFFLPLAHRLPFGGVLVEGAVRASPSRQLRASRTLLHTELESRVEHCGPQATEGHWTSKGFTSLYVILLL